MTDSPSTPAGPLPSPSDFAGAKAAGFTPEQYAFIIDIAARAAAMAVSESLRQMAQSRSLDIAGYPLTDFLRSGSIDLASQAAREPAPRTPLRGE